MNLVHYRCFKHDLSGFAVGTEMSSPVELEIGCGACGKGFAA